ncbi:Tim44 domain-containing protein [Celerinatantimonas sp. YJH-8]|uniref:Tim44 domain-containing protein n=1 Tax=Celerinatantimonas sp. YJH-8 TaxID=3228714 RepID=UPI0038C91469
MHTKRLFGLLFVVLALLTLSGHADARKFGGGRSWGRSYHTNVHPSYSSGYGHSSTSGSRLGFGHGLFGGLLAGGLLGSLFGHGGYGYGGGGFGFGNLILVAVIGWIAWRLFKSRSSSGGQNFSRRGFFEQDESRSPSGYDDVPFDLPAGFDTHAFLEEAKRHYHALQTAWNHNDFAMIRTYLAPELYQQIVAERESLGPQPQTDQILYVEASLARAAQLPGQQQISVHFTGKYRTDEAREAQIDEIWHLRRENGRDWVIEGIEENSEQ